MLLDNIELGRKRLYKRIQIKFIFFFIIGFIFLLFLWYYVAMFCVIYKNTQYHLIKDTIISSFESFIFPFIIYLLPGLFRIPALSNIKDNKEYLYKFSKIFHGFECPCL